MRTICVKLFYGLFALCFGWIALGMVRGGYYGYGAGRLLAWTIPALASVVLVWYLAGAYSAALAKAERWYGWLFPASLFAVQMVLAARLRYRPVFDVDAIFGGAVQWAETGDLGDYKEYFSYFSNNFGGLRLLYLVFRAARAVGSTDYYMAASAVNGLLCAGTVYVTGSAAARLLGPRGRAAAYALFAVSPPFWFLAPAFYTDGLSMLFPVLTYRLYQLAKDQPHRPRRAGLYVLTGFAAAAGTQIKPTAAIALIAVLIDGLFTWDWKKTAALGLVCAAVIGLGQAQLNASVSAHLDPAQTERLRTPLLHWVMMGLSDSGMYDPGDYDFTRSFEDREERDEAIRAEIGRRVAARGLSGMAELWSRKADICFGDGTYGLSDCLGGTPEGETALREFLLPGGEGYGAYKHVCGGALLAAYLLLIMGAAGDIFARGDRVFRSIAPRAAVFGLLLFLLWWEARWRYFSNFIPLIFLSALTGLDGLPLPRIGHSRPRISSKSQLREERHGETAIYRAGPAGAGSPGQGAGDIL